MDTYSEIIWKQVRSTSYISDSVDILLTFFHYYLFVILKTRVRKLILITPFQ